jgi:hypothetical protein
MKKKILAGLLKGSMKYYQVTVKDVMTPIGVGEKPPEGLQKCRAAYIWAATSLGLSARDTCAAINYNSANAIALVRRWRSNTDTVERTAVWHSMRAGMQEAIERKEFGPNLK